MKTQNWLLLTYKVPSEPAKKRIGLWRKLKVTVWPTHPSAHRPARTRTGGKQSLARRYTH